MFCVDRVQSARASYMLQGRRSHTICYANEFRQRFCFFHHSPQIARIIVHSCVGFHAIVCASFGSTFSQFYAILDKKIHTIFFSFTLKMPHCFLVSHISDDIHSLLPCLFRNYFLNGLWCYLHLVLNGDFSALCFV